MSVSIGRLETTVGRSKLRTMSFAMLVALLLIGISITWIMTVRQPKIGVASNVSEADLLKSGWKYLPGATVEADGVHVKYLGRRIVQQDGSGGQDNPAVNLYGTHFRTSGDFAITATLTDVVGTASFRLYDSAPIIQDEFRVEPKSLELSLQESTATIARWDSGTAHKLSTQAPAVSNGYSFAPGKTNRLTIERRAGRVVISLNDKILSNAPEDGLFNSNELWIGADAKESGSSWTLTRLSVAGAITAEDTESSAPIIKQSTGLQALATSRRPGFLIGAAAPLGPLVADERYAELALGGNFGQLTTENALKWQFVEPQPGLFDFHEADAIVAIAQKNNLQVHGHTLVFAEANPRWVQQLPVATPNEKQRVQQVMQDHITALVAHYKGDIRSWDVVNEPLADDNTLRQSLWYRAMGEDYIKTAFDAARAASPEAKLYINEYGLEAEGDRWNAFLALVTKLRSQGVPIDGIGFQAHVYSMDEDAIDPAVLRSHIQALAHLGLTVRISEVDVDPDQGARLQSEQYANTLAACVAEPNCVSWTTWGVTDAYNMWQDEARRLQYGEDFLWDSSYRPKQAVDAVINLLRDRKN